MENLAPGGGAITLSDIPGAYNGLVLTFVQGPLTGTSVRIIGYTGNQNGFYSQLPYTFIAYPEQTRDVPATFTDRNGNDVADIRQTQVVINGRAYFGWGAGEVRCRWRRVARPGIATKSIDQQWLLRHHRFD